MLTSMTGFGRAVLDTPLGKLTAEIQSVNRKYLEIFVSMPKELSRFEHEVRKWVGDTVSRGQVSVKIFLVPNLASLEQLLPDVELLKGLKKEWEKLAKKLKVDATEINLPFLMQYLPVGAKQDIASEKDLVAIQRCVDSALEGLLEMKKKEGKALAQDLETRLKKLGKLIDQIEKQSPDATKKMRKKLQEKLEELFKPGSDLEERVLKEVAIFAERVDISEEITRFRSHIDQFEGLFNPKGITVGRKMDFLIQEMGREANTVGSKSMEAKISHLIVDIKSELEKMREQIQNIE